jgi:E3 ubiquitin-protein ligase HUWE1
VLRDSFE